ncbi:hypothetical protein CL1_0559 [Thermococcus cleftensis]|uniref:Uncharacterized protein n=1 Tax=Thermococcus cleftensis (strain DSM 27260 / KACC 17922 / CL1) TaxID=163003 RepID=I3ZST3_THECF|nr:hypothetical protein [Thermococcus cleftensis]AFL94767.1 hypothetical protein CL1_0559 [Thermococcus cleftensis]
MKWKPLIAVLLGLLMVGMVLVSASDTVKPTKTSSIPSDGISISPLPGHEKGIIMKTFTGKLSLHLAEQFLQKYWDRLTLRIKFEEFGDATFVGIALRPLPSGAYVPLYYFGYDSDDLDVKTLTKDFYSEVSKFENTPLEVKGALSDEPPRAWKYLGAILSLRTSREIEVATAPWIVRKATVYNGVGAEFWGTYGEWGQYVYYVAITHSAEVPSDRDLPSDFKIAVKEVKDRVTVLNSDDAFIGYGSFRPDDSGSTSQSAVNWGLNLDFGIDATGRPLPTAQVGFSESHTTGLGFKWYTRIIDPNYDVQFEFYDLKKKGLLTSSPAWGQIFVSRPVVLVHVKQGTPFYEGKIRVRADATFVYEAPVDSPFSGTYVVKKDVDAPPVEFTVEMFPWEGMIQLRD